MWTRLLLLLLCVWPAHCRPKSPAEWNKLVEEKLGDVDAEWAAADSPDDVSTDNDALYAEMERRRVEIPDIEAMEAE